MSLQHYAGVVRLLSLAKISAALPKWQLQKSYRSYVCLIQPETLKSWIPSKPMLKLYNHCGVFCSTDLTSSNISENTDLLREAGRGGLSLLVLLDLSAAFDSISHSILLDRLSSMGIEGMAFSWFWSFLKGCVQRVQHEEELSTP